MMNAEERRGGPLQLILVAALGAIVFIGPACGEGGDPVPAELLGVWRAEDPPYTGRTVSIAETTISFSQGVHAYQEYPIVGAEIRDQGSSNLYVLRYKNGEQVQQITFFHEAGPESALRLQNRAEIRWHREQSAD